MLHECNCARKKSQKTVLVLHKSAACRIERKLEDYRDGLSGRLKPPVRFMYWRYSVFFSLRTP